MRKLKNTFQTNKKKKQNKTSEKELSDTEISNLHDKELKVMVIPYTSH